MKQGYFPGVATIGKNIVYIENRNGNSNVKFKQSDTLQAAYEMLERKNILIDRSRMDCGSFTKEIIETLEANSKKILYQGAALWGAFPPGKGSKRVGNRADRYI